jgi:hypothetical protein
MDVFRARRFSYIGNVVGSRRRNPIPTLVRMVQKQLFFIAFRPLEAEMNVVAEVLKVRLR